MIDPSIEFLSHTEARGEISIAARCLYLVTSKKAELLTPSNQSIFFRTNHIAWLPGGVTHELLGEALVLRLRKNAFSRDQATDVAGRNLLRKIDLYTRNNSYALPRLVRGIEVQKYLHGAFTQPGNLFLAKAHTLLILAEIASHIPNKTPTEDFAPAPTRVRNFVEWLKEHYAEPIGISEALAKTNLSKAHFHRCFQDATGTSLSRYLNRIRISVAKNLLKFSERGILDIALSCGFQSTSRFYKVFVELVGCSPKVYRSQVSEK